MIRDKLHGVWKVLPNWKIEKFFWSHDFYKGRKSQERVLRPCSSSTIKKIAVKQNQKIHYFYFHSKNELFV